MRKESWRTLNLLGSFSEGAQRALLGESRTRSEPDLSRRPRRCSSTILRRDLSVGTGVLAIMVSLMAFPLSALCESPHGGTPHRESHGVSNGGAQHREARAVLKGASGHEVHGTVSFTRGSDGIDVEGEISGLAPGEHGFHVHEKGDCSAPDASSAGGHFNPGGHQHGGLKSEMRHAGDLGNITANGAGVAHVTLHGVHLKLAGKDGIVGRALVVHEKADDLHSQPTGNSGARVACGVITKSER